MLTRALVAAVALLFAIPAQAAPPEVGQTVTFDKPSVGCALQEHLEMLADAGRSKPDGGALEMYNALKAQGVCIAGIPKNPVEVLAVVPLGVFNSPVKPSRTWAVHIKDGAGEWWFLYAEEVADLPGAES